MSDEIGFGSDGESRESTLKPRAVPMRVGSATVYVEQVGEPLEIETDDEIYAVAPSPEEAFEQASEILQECVRVMGERIKGLAENAMPSEITVEFTLSFEIKGKAHLIPVFLTGETKAATGLKVTAKWGPEAEEG